MKLIVVALMALIVVGCTLEDDVRSLNSMRDQEKVWVFAQFNVPEENDAIETYYYYGQLSKKLYDAIAHNEINFGFVKLDNVRYWGNDDLIHDYGYGGKSGQLVFRIENVVKLDHVRTEPMVGQGSEQFAAEEMEGDTTAGGE